MILHSRFEQAYLADGYQLAADCIRKKKTYHWMHWAFPQVSGLSTSVLGCYYAFQGPLEVADFFKSEIIKPMYNITLKVILDNPNMLPEIDVLKLRSHLTLLQPTNPHACIHTLAWMKLYGLL